MLSPGEIAWSLKGATRLFIGRTDGLSYFDRSINGFWRSFAVILLLLPLNAITLYAVSRYDTGPNFQEMFRSQIPVMVIDWVAFPLVLAIAARPLGITKGYVSYVVARNWCAPVASALLTIPFLLRGAGWVPAEGAEVLSLVALIVVLRYHYVIVRAALDTGVAMSIGLVIADLLLTILLSALLIG